MRKTPQKPGISSRPSHGRLVVQDSARSETKKDAVGPEPRQQKGLKEVRKTPGLPREPQ
jgi:hypothetical protein